MQKENTEKKTFEEIDTKLWLVKTRKFATVSSREGVWFSLTIKGV